MDGTGTTTDSNKLLLTALDAAERLRALADEGESNSQDDGCCVLFAIVRDCAYRIRNRAQSEIGYHRLTGRWFADPNGERVSSGDDGQLTA
jgi:hypothetical protein